MKRRIHWCGSIAVAIAFVQLVQCSSANAITVSPAPTREYVSQVWVGFSPDDENTLRIDLKADGTGSGVLLSHDEAHRFEVISWILDHRALKLSIRFADRKISTSTMAGEFKRYVLSYTVGMLQNPEKIHEGDLPGPLELSFQGGAVRFGLWPERQLQERLQRVQAVASDATRKK